MPTRLPRGIHLAGHLGLLVFLLMAPYWIPKVRDWRLDRAERAAITQLYSRQGLTPPWKRPPLSMDQYLALVGDNPMSLAASPDISAEVVSSEFTFSSTKECLNVASSPSGEAETRQPPHDDSAHPL